MSDWIDKKHLENLIEGDTEFLQQLVEIYRLDSGPRLQLMQKALEQGDSDELYREAHCFKGASANLGAIIAARVAQELENIGRKKNLDLAAEPLQRLIDSYAHSLQELESMLEA